jgi:hypothetical protein
MRAHADFIRECARVLVERLAEDGSTPSGEEMYPLLFAAALGHWGDAAQRVHVTSRTISVALRTESDNQPGDLSGLSLGCEIDGLLAHFRTKAHRLHSADLVLQLQEPLPPLPQRNLLVHHRSCPEIIAHFFECPTVPLRPLHRLEARHRVAALLDATVILFNLAVESRTNCVLHSLTQLLLNCSPIDSVIRGHFYRLSLDNVFWHSGRMPEIPYRDFG